MHRFGHGSLPGPIFDYDPSAIDYGTTAGVAISDEPCCMHCITSA